jgi:hypothetical protein
MALIHMCSSRKKYVQMAEERMGNDPNARHIPNQQNFVLKVLSGQIGSA